jgi:hypothetical protein
MGMTEMQPLGVSKRSRIHEKRYGVQWLQGEYCRVQKACDGILAPLIADGL